MFVVKLFVFKINGQDMDLSIVLLIQIYFVELKRKTCQYEQLKQI